MVGLASLGPPYIKQRVNTMDTVIRLNNVSKRYGRETALKNVSFDVPKGTVFALLGENGAGKSTSIKIMLGLADSDGGEAEVLGMPSSKSGMDIRRRVGYVAEQPTLYDWMTVREIGWFAGGFYGNGYFDEYARLAEEFGLPGDRKIKSLSKGMRAKVSLALALGHQPELLILDEPTSGLDAVVRREFLESMVDRAAAGQTVFLSSHQIAEVERVADVVAIIHKSQLVVVEPLDKLKARMTQATLTLNDEYAEMPTLPGETIDCRVKGKQCQAVLRDVPASALDALRACPSVQTLEARTPSLEEIFVAYMKGRD